MKIIKIMTFSLIILLCSIKAQQKWNFEPKGFSFYGDIFSFNNIINYSESDPRTGNFSFGTEFFIKLYSTSFYLTPGINLTYMEINGIPKEGSDYSKPFTGLPIESELLLPIIYPVSFDWKLSSIFSFFGKAGISVGGKYKITTEKQGTVLDGNKINLYAFNAGFKINFIPNLAGYISAKYYFGNNHNSTDYFNTYNVDYSKVEIFNVGFGFSYNLFNEVNLSKRTEQTNNKIDSLTQIIEQKNLALEDMKKSLDSSNYELKKYKEISLRNVPIEGKRNFIAINIDSLNNEYNAKFYKDLSLNGFLDGNNLSISDEGKALLEGYHDVATKIEINQRKGIFLKLLIPERYNSIFQNYVNEKNWQDIISVVSINNSNSVRFEINSEKIKDDFNINLEIIE